MEDNTWYRNQSDVENAAFGALAVIEPMIQKINLAEIINRHLPTDPERRMTAATMLKSFSKYAVLFHHNPISRRVSPSQLTSRQREILRRLEFPTPAQTLNAAASPVRLISIKSQSKLSLPTQFHVAENRVKPMLSLNMVSLAPRSLPAYESIYSFITHNDLPLDFSKTD